MANQTELNPVKHPFHIRHQMEYPVDLEMQVNESIDRLVGTDEARRPHAEGMRGMVQQRVLLNRAIDVLRNRLTENTNNSPAFVQWNEDLLDVIKAINNA